MLDFVFHGGDVGKDRDRTEIVEGRAVGAPRGIEDNGLERGNDGHGALLAGDAKPDAGLDKVR